MNTKKPNISKSLRAAGAIVFAFSAGSAFATPTEYNLTTAADLSETVNGAVFSNPSTLSNVVSGTGVFGTFVQIEGPNNKRIYEQGYNTSARGGFPNGQDNFDTKHPDTHNHDIQLLDVPTLLYTDGNVYRQFLLDINEGANLIDNYLSLDKLQVYISPDPGNFISNDDETVLGADNALGTLLYDLDGSPDGDSRILLNYNVMGSGSGRPDLQVLVLNDLFLTYNPSDYIYLYSRFGDKGCVDSNGNPVDQDDPLCAKKFSAENYAFNAGFEEWATLTNATDYCLEHPGSVECGGGAPDDPPLPEPASLSLMGIGLAALLGNRRKRTTA